jgi:hypothetical protein
MLGLFAVTTTAAQAAVPGRLDLGMNADKVFMLPAYRWDGLLSEMADDGVRWVRFTASWQSVEPNAPGAAGPQYNWTFMDQVAAALARHGLRWLPVIAYSTTWSASYHTPGGLLWTSQPDLYSPPVPADYGDYAGYAAAFVARYGPSGSFWAESPELTPEPVTQVQIWNEPNVSNYWAPSPNPGIYATLYAAARNAVHAVAPAEKVAVGGLGNGAGAFIDQMFAAGGGNPPVDAVADTPYDHTPATVVGDVAELRGALDSHGDVTTPIEVSEFGWPTHGSVSWTSTLTDVQRGDAITQTMQTLGTGDCGVELISPYTWLTAQVNYNNAYDWFGLVNANGTATYSSYSYATEVARLNSLQPLAHATTAACNRPFSVSAGAASGTSGQTTCVAGTATSGGFAVSGATLAVSAVDAGTGTSWSGSARTGADGSGRVCLTIPAGTPLNVTVTAEHPYFEPVPSDTFALTAGG